MSGRRVEFGSLAQLRPEVFRELEHLRREVERLLPETSQAPGVLSEQALVALERIRPGAGDALALLAGSASTSERSVVTVLLDELRAEVPRLGVRRWLSAGEYDRLQHARAAQGTARDITITTRDFDSVAALIKLDPAALRRVEDRRVLSVGEGASNFARGLEERFGAQSIAVDWWYGMPKAEMFEHVMVGERWHDSPIARVLDPAESLSRLPQLKVAGMGEALPFRSSVFDRVYLANVLGWYFSPEHRARAGLPDDRIGRAMIDEALRVTAPGGEVRFNLFSRPVAQALASELEQHAQVVRVTRLGSTLVLERGATGTAPSVP